jgi:hypothetical protein
VRGPGSRAADVRDLGREPEERDGVVGEFKMNWVTAGNNRWVLDPVRLYKGSNLTEVPSSVSDA